MPKSQKTSEKGAVPVVAIVVAVVVVLAAGGYFVMSKQGGGAPSIPGVPAGLTLNPNCKHNDPDLCKFLNNYKDIKDFKVTSQMSDKKGEKSTGVYEMNGQDKFRMTASAGGKEVMSIVTIGDTTYTKDYTDNKWWKQKANKQTSDIKEEFTKDYDVEDTEDKTTYKKTGMESCGSMQCFKYEVVYGGPEMSYSTEFIYFDDKEYRLRKTRSTDRDGSVTEAEYSYDKVSITEPSPVKEAKEGQLIIPGAGAMSESDKKEIQKMQEEAKKMEQDFGDYSSSSEDTGEE